MWGNASNAQVLVQERKQTDFAFAFYIKFGRNLERHDLSLSQRLHEISRQIAGQWEIFVTIVASA
jgi:hypothetical protein